VINIPTVKKKKYFFQKKCKEKKGKTKKIQNNEDTNKTKWL
jgi:hypothetical protein